MGGKGPRIMTDTVRTPRYWIIVGSPDNFAKTAALGFTIQGLKARHRKKAELMEPGDRIAYYITGRKAFAGIAEVTSSYFESHERIWSSTDPTKAAEDYPHRVHTTPVMILPETEYAPAEPIARAMDYAKKWPVKNWTLAFQGNVHLIGAADFAVIEAAVAARAPALAAG